MDSSRVLLTPFIGRIYSKIVYYERLKGERRFGLLVYQLVSRRRYDRRKKALEEKSKYNTRGKKFLEEL